MEKKSGSIVLVPLTLAALAALAWAVIAVTLAALAPPAYVPRIFHSSHVEHLAAFYIVTLVGSAAFARLSLFRLAAVLIAFAVLLAVIRAFQPAHQLSSAEDLLCDIAGVWAAIAPILVGRLRDRSGGGAPGDDAEASVGPWRKAYFPKGGVKSAPTDLL
jgi:hypothetical protein